jgi:hypothetical protein
MAVVTTERMKCFDESATTSHIGPTHLQNGARKAEHNSEHVQARLDVGTLSLGLDSTDKPKLPSGGILGGRVATAACCDALCCR